MGLLVKHAGAVALIAAACCAHLPARGADDRGVHGSLGLSVQADDNLFRLPEGVRPADMGVGSGTGDASSGQQRGDTVTSYVASIDAALVAGRQRVGLTATQRETHLSRYSSFDTSTHRLAARWDWQIGNHWSGVLGSSEDESASELRDLLAGSARRSVLSTRVAQAHIDWRPRPDRRISLGHERHRGRNDLPARATTDFDVTQDSLEAAWRTGVGNEFLVRWRRSANAYPNRFGAGLRDPGYRQNDADIGLLLRPGGRTRADLRLGYGKRRSELSGQRDYEGPVGRVSVSWDAIRELSLDVELSRDLNDAGAFQRPYAIATQRGAGAQLALTTQVQLAWRWTQRRTDYAGGLLALPAEFAFDARDRVTTSRLSLAWVPRLRWQVTAGWQRGRQDSTGITRPYTNEAFDVGTQYSF